MKLYINGEPAVIGKTYKDFRGDSLILVGMREPHKPGSTGRIYVKAGDYTCEYFPSVIGGKWAEEQP